MKKSSFSILPHLSFGFCVILLFVANMVFYNATNVNIFSVGFLADSFVLFGLFFLVYYGPRKAKIRKILTTVLLLIYAVLMNAEIMYYNGTGDFAKVTSLKSAKWVDAEQYGVKFLVPGLIIIALSITIIVIVFLIGEFKKIKKRYLLISLIMFLIPIFTFFRMTVFRKNFNNFLEYNGSMEYVYDTRRTATKFITCFGYFYYREADIIATISDWMW